MNPTTAAPGAYHRAIPAYALGRKGYYAPRKRRRKERRHWRKIVQRAVHPYAAEWDAQQKSMRRFFKRHPQALNALADVVAKLADSLAQTSVTVPPFNGRSHAQANGRFA
jgi:DNA polymerase III alpha subunit